MHGYRRWPGPVLTWCAALTLGSCTKWNPPAGATPEQFQHSRVWEARVVMRDSTATLRLTAPTMVGDSVIGTVGEGQRVAISVHDIQTLQVRRADVVQTSVGVITALVAAMLVLGAMIGNAYGP